MKITLEFDLPEEKVEAKAAQSGLEYLQAVEDFREYLRRKRKYEEHDEKIAKEIENIEQAFFDIFEGLL